MPRLILLERPEISDVEDRALSFLFGFEERFYGEADVEFVEFDFAQEVN
jgi:hypothetical protein